MHFKTFDADRPVIEHKYHDPDKPFNAFDRMHYHGYEFDPATGMTDEEINAGLAELAASLKGKPHPVIKGRLFAYILDHSRIDVNEHDRFVGFWTWGRRLSPYTVYPWLGEVKKAFPEETAAMADLDASGAAFGWLDFDHTVPDWDALMTLGFPGILRRAKDAFAAIENPTEKQKAFYEGMTTEYEAILRLLDRYAAYAETHPHAKSAAYAVCLKHLRAGAPTDTYEAMQLIYLYFMLSESVDHYQVRSLGYGLDATLLPFYEKDLASGRYTKEEIAELLAYFLMQWQAIGNYWGQPLYLGGMTADGRTKVNDLTYLIMEVYDKIGVYNPKIQVRYDPVIPRDFLENLLDMIRRGHSGIVFVNDDHVVKSVMSRGATYEKALDSYISGCYEYSIKAGCIGLGGGYFNMLKPVSLVLDNGVDTITGKRVGVVTGDLASLDTFDKFYRAYLAQLGHVLDTFHTALDKHATLIETINPSLMYSATITPCVTTMTDALDSAIENTTGSLICGVGTAADALMAVKTLVYDEKRVTLEELNEALHHNWEGYEGLRTAALACPHKYGNNDAVTDAYANAIVRFVTDRYASLLNSHGARYCFEMHSARAFIIHGEKTAATPDGRRAGEEISKNASPTPGMDKNGVTALVRSALSLDPSLTTVGFCLDVMLHPSAVAGDDGLAAFAAVLRTYMKGGGASIHFNVFNADTLKDAQAHPEKYKNLQVRVCGWNVLWNNMDKREQDAYILRAENIR